MTRLTPFAPPRSAMLAFALAILLAFTGATTTPVRADRIDDAMTTSQRLFDAGDYRKALIHARTALDLVERRHGRLSKPYARVLRHLARIYRNLGQTYQADELAERAKLIMTRLALDKRPTRGRKKARKSKPRPAPAPKAGNSAPAPAAPRPSIAMPKPAPPAALEAEAAAEPAPQALQIPDAIEAPAESAPTLEPRTRSVPTAVPVGRRHKDGYTVVDVYYATDRAEVATEKWDIAFGSGRGELTYGVCEVSMPPDHRPGKLEAPSWMRFEFRENPKKHVVLLEVKPLDQELYFKEIRQRVAGSNGKNAFVFVHGYNVTFENAARRTAQMAYDLGFDGAPVFYSWPSQGELSGYLADASTVQWAERNLVDFLKDFVARSNAENIYLVAHSMGNRALTGAVSTLIQENPEMKKRFREIILAAPDIDADVFKRDIAPRMIDASNNVTLYVSADDKALQVSREIHKAPRAGEAGERIIVVPGIDTIDATGLDASLLAHSYIAEVKSIIRDLLSLIREGKRAPERPTLKRMQTITGQDYWRLQADK